MDQPSNVDRPTPPTPQRAPAARRRSIVGAIVGGVLATGLVAGLVAASLTSAGAQTGSPPTGPVRGPGHGRFGEPGFGFDGFGPRVLHGEFTAKSPTGGYRTLVIQTGQVTAVSASSVTVKSEDGFTRTYAVNTGTMVNAGRDGIGSVRSGDTVHVVATSGAGKSTALQIVDATNLRRSIGGWMPPGPLGPSGGWRRSPQRGSPAAAGA
jgi:hypothetical protein